VSPSRRAKERHPNDRLGQWLWNTKTSIRSDHRWTNPAGRRSRPRKTAVEWDRAIWAGLGRDPEAGESRQSWSSSSPEVRSIRTGIHRQAAEYREIGVRQYWVIDRFRRTLTVYTFSGESDQVQVISENQNYESPLLPGFELPLGLLLKLADAGQRSGARYICLTPPLLQLFYL